MAEYIARAYFRYNTARYRITVFEDVVWVERQTPHVVGGNLPMKAITPEMVLYGTESWIVEALANVFDEYEAQLDD